MKRSQELSSLSREHTRREHGAGHFEAEERVLLGFLTAAEADRLLAEHDAIRARVDELAGCPARGDSRPRASWARSSTTTSASRNACCSRRWSGA